MAAEARCLAELASFLTEIGAERIAHGEGSLAAHLMGTCRLMCEAGIDEQTCLAGGLHSIYGTNFFKVSMLSVSNLSERRRVARRFGHHVERLAFLFHAINRPAGLNASSRLQCQGRDVLWLPASTSSDAESGHIESPIRSDGKCALRPQTLEALRLVEAANLLDQGSRLERYPHIARVWHDARAGSINEERKSE